MSSQSTHIEQIKHDDYWTIELYSDASGFKAEVYTPINKQPLRVVAGETQQEVMDEAKKWCDEIPF